MTEEYEKFLEDILGVEYNLERTSSGYDVTHSSIDESMSLLTEKGNLTKPTSYLLERRFGVDTEYGIGQLLEERTKLEQIGVLEDGEIVIDIPEQWEKLHHEQDALFDSSRELPEEFDRFEKQVSRVIDGADKTHMSSREIAEHTEDLSPNQVGRTMRGIAIKEGLEGELRRRSRTPSTWNVEKLNYDTDVVVELD